jgi:hypothetical protein
MDLNSQQFSAYDERPDPKKPGQQGVLFRKVAPAMDQRRREHLAPERSLADFSRRSWSSKDPVAAYNDPENWRDERLAKGRATGLVDVNALVHGTAARLKPGSLIKPGKPSNWVGRTADVNSEYAFATPNLHDAFRYAHKAKESGNRNSGRPGVYRVQPTGPVQIDPEDEDARAGYSEGADAFQSKHPFKVLSKVQFSDAQEAWREHNEDDMGMEPGSYEYAPKQRQDYW